MFNNSNPQEELDLTPTTLELNLKAGRYDNSWTGEGTRNRKRAAIRRARKAFARVGGYILEEEFPNSREEVEFFAARYLHSDESARRATFKSAKAAQHWVDEFCTILDVASGFRGRVQSLRTQNDDWAELFSHLIGHEDGPSVFSTYEMMPITSLVMVCREHGITIATLNSAFVHEIFPSLPKKKQDAVLKGLTFLHRLHGSNTVPSELLPNVDPAELKGLVLQRTRVVPPMHPDFELLMQRFLAKARDGKVTVNFGTKIKELSTKELSEDRIKNLKDAARWLWHGLVALNIADRWRPFERYFLSDVAVFSDVVDACSTGRLGPVSSSQTRRDRAMDAISFLDWVTPGFRDKIPSSFYQSKEVWRVGKRETEDKRKKEIACTDFVNSEEKQANFFMLPKFYFDQAQPIISELKSQVPKNGYKITGVQKHAIQQGVMAALTAIVTVYPSRLKTVHQFASAGKEPNVRFPNDNRSDSLVLDIPGHMVKNGHSIYGLPLEPNDYFSPREILAWYCNDVQPLVLRYMHKHHSRRRPDLLFTGLHIETLRRYWTIHTALAGIELTFHMCRHFSASLLLSNGVPLPNVAKLLGISEAVVCKNYAFVSDLLIVQNVLNVQTEIYRKAKL